MTQQKEESFSIRIPKDMNEKIEKLAEEENRSKNRQIITLLKKGLEK